MANFAKKMCKCCPNPAICGVVTLMSSIGEKKRVNVSSKSVPLCARCLAIWTRLSSGCASESVEAAREVLASKYARAEHDLKQGMPYFEMSGEPIVLKTKRTRSKDTRVKLPRDLAETALFIVRKVEGAVGKKEQDRKRLEERLSKSLT